VRTRRAPHAIVEHAEALLIAAIAALLSGDRPTQTTRDIEARLAIVDATTGA
jgi:hypothetical protein